MTSKSIGGYFELELHDCGGFLHDDGVLLNSGRNALEYVFRAMRDVRYVYVPYFTCDAVLEPINKLDISYSFYHINQKLEIESLPSLQSGDYLLYTNYFGVKDEYVKALANLYGSKLIVDNAQAWFAEPIEGCNTIYSPRKYVGVPDGGVAYCPKRINEINFEQDVSFERCSHLLKRIDLGPSEGYADFKENGKQLIGQPIKRMSNLTQRMLSSIDFDAVKTKRRENYEFLHEQLRKSNLFNLPLEDSFACSIVYPYLCNDNLLRQRLIENHVFVASYWPNVDDWLEDVGIEHDLVELLIPIPIDQRYGSHDMSQIINLIIA